MITLGEYMADKLGFDASGRYRCPGCAVRLPAFALTKSDDGLWRCGHCRTDTTRADLPGFELTLDDIRGARNLELSRTDWTQLPDVPAATQLLWQPYRQQLRDLTNNVTDAAIVVWPVAPS